MRKIFLFLSSILLLFAFLSCANQDKLISTLTIKYFEENDSKFEIATLQVPLYKGTTINSSNVKKLIASRLRLKSFTVVKFFKGVDEVGNRFDDKYDYYSPSAMPPSNKIAKEIEDLSREPIDKDTTVYCYYSRAAEKDYIYTFHCLNFAGVTYGPTNAPTTARTFYIKFNEGDHMTLDVLKERVKDYVQSEDMVFKEGIYKFATYIYEDFYNLPEGVEYDADKAITPAESFGKPIEDLGYDENQTYYVGYRLKRENNVAYTISIRYLSYTPGTSTNFGTINVEKDEINVDTAFINNPTTLLMLETQIREGNYLNPIELQESDYTISSLEPSNEDGRFDIYYKLIPYFSTLVTERVDGDNGKLIKDPDEYVAPILGRPGKPLALSITRRTVSEDSTDDNIADGAFPFTQVSENKHLNSAKFGPSDTNLYLIYFFETRLGYLN